LNAPKRPAIDGEYDELWPPNASRLFQFSLRRIHLLLNFGTAGLLCMELFLQMVPFFLCRCEVAIQLLGLCPNIAESCSEVGTLLLQDCKLFLKLSVFFIQPASLLLQIIHIEKTHGSRIGKNPRKHQVRQKHRWSKRWSSRAWTPGE